MPKRKYNKNFDYISDQIKKLKKKLKHARKQNESSDSNTESKNSSDVNGLLEELIIDLEINDIGLETEHLPEISHVVPNPSNTELVPECDLTNPDQISSENVNQEFENTQLDKDILELLGDDPSTSVQYGEEIHKKLATELQHITTNGLTKETRKELQLMYLLLSNGILLGAPAMNPDIKAALPGTLVNRDKAIESKQKLLAAAISCLSSATSHLLQPQNPNKELLKKLMDANKFLCDIQHSDSVTRRMFSTSVLKKDVKPQNLNSKIDKSLFGENLADTLKTAKAVSKSSAEIKSAPIRKDKRPQPTTSKTGHLNVKSQVARPRRQPVTGLKTHDPTSNQNRPAESSKTSSQPQKTSSYQR